MTTDVAKVDAGGVAIAPAASKSQILVLDQTLQTARREIAEAQAAGNEMLKALTLAKATQRLRALLTPDLMSDVMALMNTPLGFRTDRDPGRDKQTHPYPVETVRDVAITAIWKLAGKPGQLACCKTADSDTRIPIRVNKGMGIDAILGKARRKFLARVLDLLDGTSFEVEDAAIEGQILGHAATTLDPPGVYETATPPKPDQPPGPVVPPGLDGQQLLLDVEGTLLTCDQVSDAQKLGEIYLNRIAKMEAEGFASAQADILRRVIAGSVEARVKEIKSQRGERSNRKTN